MHPVFWRFLHSTWQKGILGDGICWKNYLNCPFAIESGEYSLNLEINPYGSLIYTEPQLSGPAPEIESGSNVCLCFFWSGFLLAYSRQTYKPFCWSCFSETKVTFGAQFIAIDEQCLNFVSSMITQRLSTCTGPNYWKRMLVLSKSSYSNSSEKNNIFCSSRATLQPPHQQTDMKNKECYYFCETLWEVHVFTCPATINPDLLLFMNQEKPPNNVPVPNAGPARLCI